MKMKIKMDCNTDDYYPYLLSFTVHSASYGMAIPMSTGSTKSSGMSEAQQPMLLSLSVLSAACAPYPWMLETHPIIATCPPPAAEGEIHKINAQHP